MTVRGVRRAAPALALAMATCLPAAHAREAGAKESSMQDAGQAAPFVFTRTSRGGKPMPGGLRQRQSALRVDFAAGVVTYEQHRSDADTGGEPIGTFRVPLSPECRRGLLAALESDALQGLGPTSGGELGSSLLTYTFERGGTTIVKTLSTGDRAQLQRVAALENELQGLWAEVFRRPVAAVRAEIRHEMEGTVERFELVVANVGTAPVVVPNPRRLAAAGGTGGVRVAIAEAEVPGLTPLPPEWTTLPLEPLPAGKDEPADLTLAPGERVAARTVPWRRAGPKGAEYYAMAFLESYAGPPEVSGVYRARGAIVSEPLDLAAR